MKNVHAVFGTNAQFTSALYRDREAGCDSSNEITITPSHQRSDIMKIPYGKVFLRACTVLALICTVQVQAAYRETMDPNGPSKNLKSDYGLVDNNAASNQSALLQKAIDEISKNGGGRLIMPQGVYAFAGIDMKSNVHLLIARDTVIKPWWPKGTKVVVFLLDGSRTNPKGFIENVSIRGLDGPFIVDYSERGYHNGEGSRVVNCKSVRNFLLSDIFVKDSFTTYCAVIFTPSNDQGATKREVYRPTDGLVKNLTSTDSSPGYGLVQMHAAARIHFENLKAYGGGVTLRLEVGAGGENGGIFDITAKNIYCENGTTAVLMGPHTARNGMVTIDGVTAKSCAWAVTMGSGFIDRKHTNDPNAKPGRFADGSTVKNIHAIFGPNAVIALKGFANVPKAYYGELRIDTNIPKGSEKWIRGPSVGVVRDGTEGSWRPVIENVTQEGFAYNLGITKSGKARIKVSDALKGLPILDQLEAKKGKKGGGNE